jgi:ribosomal protein S18 acetylase RimI-like enzyme
MARLRRLRAAFPPIVGEDFYLRVLGLAPRLRHKGLGPVLVARYLADGERAGFSRFRLEVHAENTPAVRLYEKAGFHATAETIEPESGSRVLSMVLERKASRAD